MHTLQPVGFIVFLVIDIFRCINGYIIHVYNTCKYKTEERT